MKKHTAAVLLALALTGLAGCEAYPPRGDVRVHDRDYDVRVVFSERDRSILRDYYRGYRLPPGLAKKGKIPPGHAYRLQRQQRLPSGANWEYLPPELDRRLSRLPEDYVRIVIGGDVAILHTRTRVVLDVVEDLHD